MRIESEPLSRVSRFNEERLRSLRTPEGMSELLTISSLLIKSDPFVTQVASRKEELRANLHVSCESITLNDGQFTNFYAISFDPQEGLYTPEIYSSETPSYLRRRMINDRQGHLKECVRGMSSEPAIVAGITGGFHFFVDIAPSWLPKDPNEHFCMRGKQIVGLPTVDRPALVVQKGVLTALHLIASGRIQLGSQEVNWVGARSHFNVPDQKGAWITRTYPEQINPKEVLLENFTGNYRRAYAGMAVLYNAACSTVSVLRDPVFPEKRMLIEQLNYLPKVEGTVNVIINRGEDGQLRISDLRSGHEDTNLFEGLFILQFHKEDAKDLNIGDEVHPLVLKGYPLNSREGLQDIDLQVITSGITVGPNLHEMTYNRRRARAIVYQEQGEKGFVHFGVFDGAPETKSFQGPDLSELLSLLPREKVKWACLLDSGRTAKLGWWEPGGELALVGNHQYIRRSKRGGEYLLNGPNGRRVTSFLFLKCNRPDNLS